MARGGDRTLSKVIYYTFAEWEQMREQARTAGVPAGRYIRESSLGKKPKARPNRQAEELIYHLARIGNNLNQLAKKANEGRYPPEGRINRVIDILMAKIDEI